MGWRVCGETPLHISDGIWEASLGPADQEIRVTESMILAVSDRVTGYYVGAGLSFNSWVGSGHNRVKSSDPVPSLNWGEENQFQHVNRRPH